MWYLWPHLLLLPYAASLLGLAMYGRRSREHAARSSWMLLAIAGVALGVSVVITAIPAAEALYRLRTHAPAVEDPYGGHRAFMMSWPGCFVGATLPTWVALRRRAVRR